MISPHYDEYSRSTEGDWVYMISLTWLKPNNLNKRVHKDSHKLIINDFLGLIGLKYKSTRNDN